MSKAWASAFESQVLGIVGFGWRDGVKEIDTRKQFPDSGLGGGRPHLQAAGAVGVRSARLRDAPDWQHGALLPLGRRELAAKFSSSSSARELLVLRAAQNNKQGSEP